MWKLNFNNWAVNSSLVSLVFANTFYMWNGWIQRKNNFVRNQTYQSVLRYSSRVSHSNVYYNEGETRLWDYINSNCTTKYKIWCIGYILVIFKGSSLVGAPKALDDSNNNNEVISYKTMFMGKWWGIGNMVSEYNMDYKIQW